MEASVEFLASNEGLLAAITYIIAIVSVPVFLLSYILNLMQEKRAYDRAIHERLDGPYYTYLQYCIEYPELDVGEFPLACPPDLSEIERQKQRAIFAHLMSMFETAYILYARSTSSAKKKQWAGWDAYIESFCARPDFRRAWLDGYSLYVETGEGQAGSTLDRSFDAYMRSKISDPT